MYQNHAENSPFKGWLLFFLVYHVVVALVMFSNGLTAIYSLASQSGPIWFAILNGLFFFPLPVGLFFFLKRQRLAFQILFAVYGACGAMMFISNGVSSAASAGLPSAQGVFAGIILTCILIVPWLIYAFASQRMKAYFENAIPPAEEARDSENGDAVE